MLEQLDVADEQVYARFIGLALSSSGTCSVETFESHSLAIGGRGCGSLAVRYCPALRPATHSRTTEVVDVSRKTGGIVSFDRWSGPVW